MYVHGAKVIRVVPDPLAKPSSQKQDGGPQTVGRRGRGTQTEGPSDTARPDVGWGSAVTGGLFG